MKNEQPLVSIITPSYNQGQFIEATLLSVKNQNYPNIEHIVVDGGSTDNTLEILKKYEGTYTMRWVSEVDRGQSDAVNKGFKMARGEIIGWLNSDDCYFDIGAVSTVVRYFDEYNEVDVIYGNVARIDENNSLLFIIKSRKFDYKLLRKAGFFFQPAVFFSRRVIDKFELDVSLQFAMDYDFWLRIAREHRFRYVNRIFAADRTHSERKVLAKRDEVVEELRRISEEQPNLLDRIRLWKLRRLDKIYGIIEILRLKHRYNFAFDLEMDNIVVSILRQARRILPGISR